MRIIVLYESLKGHNIILSRFSVRGSFISEEIFPVTLVTLVRRSPLSFNGKIKTIRRSELWGNSFILKLLNRIWSLMVPAMVWVSSFQIYLQFYPKIYSWPRITIVKQKLWNTDASICSCFDPISLDKHFILLCTVQKLLQWI